MHKILKIAFATLASAFLSGPSQADPYLREVAIQLRTAVAGEDIAYVHNGDLPDGYHQDLTLFLESGTPYRIHGACDRDCADLDLELFDRSGQLIVSDVELDDFPILWVTVRRSGSYTLRVSMADCGISPCTFGVAAVTE